MTSQEHNIIFIDSEISNGSDNGSDGSFDVSKDSWKEISADQMTDMAQNDQSNDLTQETQEDVLSDSVSDASDIQIEIKDIPSEMLPDVSKDSSVDSVADVIFDVSNDTGDIFKLPAGCCNTVEDCGTKGYYVCVKTVSDKFGVCLAPPPDGSCWLDSDCDSEQTCKDALFCQCEDQSNPGCASGMVPQFGYCANPIPECCYSNYDCNGWICVGATSSSKGVCVPPLQSGQCYGQKDCKISEYCSNAQICPCGADCPTIAGSCEPVYDKCCYIDQMCKQDEECVGVGYGGYPGTCLPVPPEGQCWKNDECDDGETCDGYYYCACGEVCNMMMTDTPGNCVPVSEKCCTENWECGEGYECVGAFFDPTFPPVQGKCIPHPSWGECYTDNDCSYNHICEDQAVCSCGEKCEIVPGNCVEEENKCESSCDCPQGLKCVTYCGNGWCDSNCYEQENPVYCCDKGGCPKNQPCVHWNGSSGKCK
jgi:hypothetical protein